MTTRVPSRQRPACRRLALVRALLACSRSLPAAADRGRRRCSRSTTRPAASTTPGRASPSTTGVNWDAVPGLRDALEHVARDRAARELVATALGTLIALALVRYGSAAAAPTNFLIFLPMATPEIVLGASLLTLFLNQTLLDARLLDDLDRARHVLHLASSSSRCARGWSASTATSRRRRWTSARTSGRPSGKVTLPLIAPAILAGALLAFALSVDDFVITYFNSGQRDHVPALRLGRGARRRAAAGERDRHRDLPRRCRR